MSDIKDKARKLIVEFKGGSYIYGNGCLPRIGELVSPYGPKVLLVSGLDARDPENYDTVLDSLAQAGLSVVGKTPSARPNTPRDDVLRMKDAILDSDPDCVVAVSGGSGIDAAKAAIVLATLGGDFEDYFGTGQVTAKLAVTGSALRPCIPVQTASGSSAHLTKYSNITDPKENQKKLIVDDAIVPPRCLFDYSLTRSMSREFTGDGAFDGLAHCLEVYYGAPPEHINKIEEIALTGIELILTYLEKAVAEPDDLTAREALGLATDLGGYAVMLGGTNGGHLTSFSLVDILSHGRACSIMNPYYTVFFAPSIQRHLQQLSALFARLGLMEEAQRSFSGKALAVDVAEALIGFGRRIDYPATLKEIPGFTEAHIRRALEAAKNPQLDMKLKNMPVSLNASLVDEYMGPILEAAYTGDFNLIKVWRLAMHEILFDFGRQQIPIQVPDQADILRMGKAEALPNPEMEIRTALRKPIGCPSLAQIIQKKLSEKSNAHAVVVISDDTRPVPYTGEAGILFPLIEEMLHAGLKATQISILVATGTHHAMSDEILRERLDPRVLALKLPIHNHDCRDRSQLIAVGKTEIGGEIFLNRHYVQSDIKILTGLVESHFMAGASGGRKSICPGLLAERSIHILHGASILSSSLAADLVLEGNPVHEEALAVARMAGCDFIVNVTLDANYQPTGIFCGDLEKAHLEAVQKLKTYAAIPFEFRYDLVLGQSGYAGINHYQAAKAALVCAGVLEHEGICILATSHPDTDPIGSPNYKSMMKLLGELGSDSFLETILNPEWTFVPDQWEAQMWTRLFKITPPENLYYCSLEIQESDFAWLPGTDARDFAPSAKDLKVLVEATLSTAMNRLQKRGGKPPRIAVLPDGPYGIPVDAGTLF